MPYTEQPVEVQQQLPHRLADTSPVGQILRIAKAPEGSNGTDNLFRCVNHLFRSADGLL